MIIFDFDQTLVDTKPVEALRADRRWREVMAAVALFDLTFDPAEYVGQSAKRLVDALDGKVKAFRRIQTNAQQLLFEVGAMPSEIRGGRPAPGVYEARARLVRENETFRKKVAETLQIRRPEEDGRPPPMSRPRSAVNSPS